MPATPFQVAIVGRPNVGKSALFNRLAGRRIAIVHDRPGVTRDRISAPFPGLCQPAELIDTGGIAASGEDPFSKAVTVEAQIAMDSADLILFVVDAREGINPIDELVAQLLRKAKPPVLFVLNKADHAKQDLIVGDFAKLGFGEALPVSAEHGRGVTELIDSINEQLAQLEAKAQSEEEEENDGQKVIPGLKIAIVGKPNAGKSSLVNAILEDERTIVSDVAGTTRDAVDIPYLHDGEEHVLIDTAGLRRKTSRDDAVEVFSAMRTEKSIRRADLCLLVVDLDEGVSAQDRTIAQFIQKGNKPCLIIANKFDLYRPSDPKHLRVEDATAHLRKEFFFLSYAPFVCVSAKNGYALQHIFRQIKKIRDGAQETLSTGALNRLLQDAFISNPPPEQRKYRKRLKLFYATTAVNERYRSIPVPEYILFVNDKRLAVDAYASYLTKIIQKAHPTPGLPTPLSFRSRNQKSK